MSAIKVIGIGTESHGDAAVGVAVARKLKSMHIPGVTVLALADDGVELMDAWENASAVFFVDAACSNSAPGTIYRCDACDDDRMLHALYSTEVFSFCEAIDLARSIDLTPECPVLYAIEGASFEPGSGLTAAVSEAVDEVVRRIEREIADLHHSQEVLSTRD